MKKSLPRLPALAAFIIATAAIAEPNLPLPPGEGRVAQDSPRRGEGAYAAGLSDPGFNSSQVPLNLPADSDADQPAIGDRLLLQVTNQLERRASVSARLRHQVALAGQQLYGVGSYWQQGSGEELKVRLELQIAGQDSQLLQVCNSRFMWIDRKLPTGRYVSRIDLRQIRTDPALGSSKLNDIKPGEANWSSLQSQLTAYTGGLPTLLAALGENFTFMPPQAMRLALAPPLAAEPTSVPVFAVVGHWKSDRLATLLANAPASGEAQAAPPTLPDRMPQEVLLLVGQADMFPYRIEYRRLETPEILDADGPPIPYQLSVHPMVVLELSDVVFDSPIAAGQFDFIPGDADWFDRTTAVLEHLRQQHQAQIATRPIDAITPARQ